LHSRSAAPIGIELITDSRSLDASNRRSGLVLGRSDESTFVTD